ncbi:hypothetical protein BM536_007470 [Streptomyces phaeoluteigriseus]|uniref:Uncharacterized protein n=1 Tax=Streptomyces phaeoluteigriseus TaxID=114686 RepID=A0A1V6MWH2_9ACTN|nr:hypothetical protein BM536_007470 [Streptomyces phaeoluteigriseus]
MAPQPGRGRSRNDGTSTFAADTTFHRTAGLADASRHSDFVLRIDPVSTAADRQDATSRFGH